MTSLNDCSRQHRDSVTSSSLIARVLSVVLRCFVTYMAVLYAAKMAAIFTVDQLLTDDPVSAAVAADDRDRDRDVISTVTGSDVSSERK